MSAGRLPGVRALVTGGSRGIGRAVAGALTAEGALVAVASRGVDELSRVIEREEATLAIPLDVTDEAACAGAVRRCEEELGGIDVLVHGAGVAASGRFTRLETSTWREVMAVDLDGPFFLTRAALPGMLERGAGAVVAIASIAARVGAPYVAAYTAAKHGLLGLMRALAAEHARSGVTFNCICPGYVETPMTERTVAAIVERTGRGREEALRALHTPQGRLVAPDEVAALCVLLASREGRSINGQAIVVDGGQVQA